MVYETGKEQKITFEIGFWFQAEAYEDPNPPPVQPEEEKKKGAKGKAKDVPEEPEIRMITPDPVLMAHESGRVFEFELGRLEKFKIPLPEVQEGEEQPPPEEEQFEEKWVQYKFD